MEADFRAILAGHAPLTALVSTRIYPTVYPQGSANPAIRYNKVSGLTGLHMQGSDGLTESLMQIDIRGLASAGLVPVMSIRNALVELLNPYRGIVGNTDFRLISLNNDRGGGFEKPDAVEYVTHTLDFSIWSRAA